MGESGIVRHAPAVTRATRLFTTAEGVSSAEVKGCKYLVSSVFVRQGVLIGGWESCAR
jgi:hypothetical protein